MIRDWLNSKEYDDWKLNPPEDKTPEHTLFCECGEPIEPNDTYYLIDGMTLCEECAKAWLDDHSFTATESDCYGEL